MARESAHALPFRGAGQHDIGEARRGVEGVGHVGHEVQLLEGLHRRHGAHGGLQRVAPFHAQPLEVGFLDGLGVELGAVGGAGAVVAALLDALPHQGFGHRVGHGVLRRRQTGLSHGDQLGTASARVGLVGTAARVARLAEVRAHGPHGHEQLRDVVGAVAASQGVVVHQHDRMVAADGLGEPHDVIDRRPAQSAGPRGGLGHAVIGTFQVSAEVLVGGGVGGHRLGVEAHAVGVQKVEIGHILGEHLVAHAQHEGSIGAGQHGNPAGIEVGRRRVVGGADVDELHAGILGLVEVVHRGAARRPGGIAAHEHDGLGVLVVEAVVELPQILGGQPQRPQVEGVGAGRAGVGQTHMTAQLVQDLAHGQGLGADHRRGTEVAVDALGFLGDVAEGLVPADLLPFIGAAQIAAGVLAATRLPVLALQGELHAVLAVHLLGTGASAGTAALLEPAEAVLVRRFASMAHHFPVAH